MDLLLVVDAEADGRSELQPLFQHCSYAQDGLGLVGVCEPDCELVSSASDVDHGSINLQEKDVK